MNVLFITADQWRGDCLSAAGHPCLGTPNLDRLAAEGVRFARHYSQSTPCGPGRACLYTGTYLHTNRSISNGTPLDSRFTNVALEARKAGYEPVLFGYTDTSADPRNFTPGDPALTTYEGVLPGMTAELRFDESYLPWLADLRAKGYEITARDIFRPEGTEGDSAAQGPSAAPARYKAADSSTALLTDAAIEYLSVRGERPWFLHLSYLSPHPPFVAPAPYHRLYDPDDVPAPRRAASLEEEAAQHPWLAYRLANPKGSALAWGVPAADGPRLAERQVRQLRATYYGMISEVDDQIGRLIDHLKAAGAYDQTLIVFTSDHGEHLGDHWQFGKLSYFDQAFHVPLIVRDPRRPKAQGRTVEAFTENVDVMPTILDALGFDVPNQCDGRSLGPFLAGEAPADWRREAHWEYDFRDLVERHPEQALGLPSDHCTMNVIRGARYKYVHFTALPPVFFDLEEDPGETRNLAADPGYGDLVREYAQRLLSWRMAYADRAFTDVLLTPDGPLQRPRWSRGA